MRTNLFLIILIIVSFGSCKAPLPIYFNKPIGEKKAVFPDNIQGYYCSLDKIIDENQKSSIGKYCLKDGKIAIKDAVVKTNTKELQNSISDSTQKEIAVISNDTAVSPIHEEINDFKKLAQLNKLSFNNVDSVLSSLDKKTKIAFGFLKIAPEKISVVYVDSLGKNDESILFKLDEQLKLTSYSGTYYLNFKTLYGWEIMQIDAWDKGNYLNLIPFYLTDYNDKTGNRSVLLHSTRNVYPRLKPIYNSEKLIVGFRGKTKPKLLVEKFKKSEFNFVLMKVKIE